MAKPDLVRLAEYAMTDSARHSPGEIEIRLTRELERAIAATEGGGRLSLEARALHGLPEPLPVAEYLRGLDRAELEQRLDQLVEQWSEATAAAYERSEENLVPDANAPIAIVRPDLHPLAAIGLGIDASRKLTQDQVEALLAGRRADGEPIEGKTYAKVRQLPVDPRTGEARSSTPIGSYDFSTSADKSVSVAWAFANPRERAKSSTPMSKRHVRPWHIWRTGSGEPASVMAATAERRRAMSPGWNSPTTPRGARSSTSPTAKSCCAATMVRRATRSCTRII